MPGEKINFQGCEWIVVDVLEEHLMVIRNTGVYPAAPVLIPKEPVHGKAIDKP